MLEKCCYLQQQLQLLPDILIEYPLNENKQNFDVKLAYDGKQCKGDDIFHCVRHTLRKNNESDSVFRRTCPSDTKKFDQIRKTLTITDFNKRLDKVSVAYAIPNIKGRKLEARTMRRSTPVN